MEFIRETTLFTALLHCVLATSLPTDYPPHPYVPVSYIPDKGIVPKQYSEVDKIDLPRPYYMSPSWHHLPPAKEPEINEEEKESKPKKSSNQVRNISNNRGKPELHSILPNVKLGFAGLRGMISKYNKNQETGPEPPTVVIKSGLNRSKPDEKEKLAPYKKGQPMFKPENPEVLYLKDLPISYRYTPPAKPDQLRNMDTTDSEIDYGQLKEEDDYSSYKSLPYDGSHENVYRSTPGSLKNHAIHTSPYNDEPVAKTPMYDYRPTQPIGKEDKQVVLPPVPKSMSLLRRVYIALLNTISNLPGGNPAALETLRLG